MRRNFKIGAPASHIGDHAPDAAFAWLWLAALPLFLLANGGKLAHLEPGRTIVAAAIGANVLVFWLRLAIRYRRGAVKRSDPAPLPRRYLANAIISATVFGLVLSLPLVTSLVCPRPAVSANPPAAPRLA